MKPSNAFSALSLPAYVLAAKQRLTEGQFELERRHAARCSAAELCRAMTDLRDEALLALSEAVLADQPEADAEQFWREVALVAHAGYGRRDVAPYSDVDLMVLHAPNAEPRVAKFAERLFRDVFDAGLILGTALGLQNKHVGLLAVKRKFVPRWSNRDS